MIGRRRIARSARAVAAVAIAAAVFGVAACGGGGDEEEPAGADLTEIRCPMVETGEVDGIPQYEPADDSFDTAELVGLELDEARSHADQHGCEIIVSLEDGDGQPVPIEIDPTRVYVYVEDDVVTYIEGVGGGI